MLDKILSKEIIAPIIIIVVSMLVYFVLTRIINKLYKLKLSNKYDKRQKTIKGLINNIIKYFIVIVDLAMILEIYGIDTMSLIASLGVVSLVAGLALQDVLKDFIVGISILMEEQYDVGDTVEIGGFKGEITKFGLRVTHIRAYTGETKIISNRNITELINYNLSTNIVLVNVMISYEADLLKAKEVIQKVCAIVGEETTSEIECLGVDELADSGVILKVAISSKFNDKYAIARKFKERIKLTFDKEGIEIPYPQVVIHNGKGI